MKKQTENPARERHQQKEVAPPTAAAALVRKERKTTALGDESKDLSVRSNARTSVLNRIMNFPVRPHQGP